MKIGVTGLLEEQRASMLHSAPLSRVLGTAWPSTRPGLRQQLGSLRLNAPERRRIRRLAAKGSTPSDGDFLYDSYDSDDELPPPTTFDTSLSDIFELDQEADRFLAEVKAYDRAVERRRARQLAKARKAAGTALQPPEPPAPPVPPPLASLAAEWPPVSDSSLPGDSAARASVAEAAAAAAVAYAAAAVGHEVAAEAAFEAAGTKPASAVSSAGDEWLHAGAAWRKAFDSLRAARRAQPGAAVVEQAAAEVEAARRFKHQLRGLPGRLAGDLP